MSTASSVRRGSSAYGPIGLGAEPADVYTISRGDLAAVVSDAPLEVLDPTRDNVLAHQRVNETGDEASHRSADVVRDGLQDA